MMLDWRTGLALLPILLLSLALLVGDLLIVGGAQRSLNRIEAIDRKQELIQSLDAATTGYALRVSEALYEGREVQEPLKAARREMERLLVRLTQETREQAATAPSEAETRDMLGDVENARRMLELYHAIDLSAARALVLARDGSVPEAQRLYRREVDFRLTSEFAALRDDALSGERQRRAAEVETWNRAREWGRMAGGVLGAALLVALLLAWTLLSRRKGAPPELLADFEARTEELRSANRQLREIDARRAQFLADVSHELRTPLTILQGEADVALLPASKPEDRRRSLERIQDQAAELAQLLEDLIAFARSDAEPQSLTLGPVLIDDLLATVVDEGETLAEPREVTIALALHDRGLWVEADLRRLKQALVIGLDNAINHSPPGSAVAIELAQRAEMVRITISDMGPGLTESDQQRAFERFYRGGTSSNSFGLGIGLAIARSIVEQHHGTIELANRAEAGAVLTIALPRAREARP